MSRRGQPDRRARRTGGDATKGRSGRRSGRRGREFDLSPGAAFAPGAWLAGHGQAALSSLGRLVDRPIATSVTVLAIAVVLSLPFTLYVLLDNAHRAMGRIDRPAQLTAYLRHDVDEAQTATLASALRQWDTVQDVRIIGRDEALAEYRQMTGFDDVQDIFEGQNPLPDLLVVSLGAAQPDRAALVALRDRVAAWSEIESVQLDLLWVDRLAAILETLHRIVQVLFALLGLGILLIVGNTIRLGIESRREEIGIIRLFGATDAFIRRPFLYIGLWHGLAAGAFACLLVAGATRLATGPVERLIVLYSNDFVLVGLQPWSTGVAIAAGGLLGLGGAWIAVSRELAEGSGER